MLPPLFPCLVYCGLGSETEGLEFFFGEQFGESSIEEHELSDDVGDVELAGHLLSALVVEVGGRPVRLELALAEETLEDHGEVVEEVEGAGGDLFSVVVEHHLPGNAHLVGLLSVELHYEYQPDYGADQPSHVREIIINFIETPLVGGRFRRSPK